jgi:hypothetical protein
MEAERQLFNAMMEELKKHSNGEHLKSIHYYSEGFVDDLIQKVAEPPRALELRLRNVVCADEVDKFLLVVVIETTVIKTFSCFFSSQQSMPSTYTRSRRTFRPSLFCKLSHFLWGQILSNA